MQHQHQLVAASATIVIFQSIASTVEVKEFQLASGTIAATPISIAPFAELAFVIYHIAQYLITDFKRLAYWIR
jgi:predicted Kef-type K+ transport protein